MTTMRDGLIDGGTFIFGYRSGQRCYSYVHFERGAEGTVIEDPDPAGERVHVRWDDGTTGWPLRDALRPEVSL